MGPVTFVGLDAYASAKPDSLLPSDGKDPHAKVIAVVRTGEPVTVRVAPAGQVALEYDLEAHPRVVAQGDTAVTFMPCRPGKSPYDAASTERMTQFNGGFILAGPGCVDLEVQPKGSGPLSRSVAFGAGETCG